MYRQLLEFLLQPENLSLVVQLFLVVFNRDRHVGISSIPMFDQLLGMCSVVHMNRLTTEYIYNEINAIFHF